MNNCDVQRSYQLYMEHRFWAKRGSTQYQVGLLYYLLLSINSDELVMGKVGHVQHHPRLSFSLQLSCISFGPGTRNLYSLFRLLELYRKKGDTKFLVETCLDYKAALSIVLKWSRGDQQTDTEHITWFIKRENRSLIQNRCCCR